MRISTAQYYKTNADQLQARQNKVAEVQAKLGSGKQLLHPSENPSKADLISRLESGKEDKLCTVRTWMQRRRV